MIAIIKKSPPELPARATPNGTRLCFRYRDAFSASIITSQIFTGRVLRFVQRQIYVKLDARRTKSSSALCENKQKKCRLTRLLAYYILLMPFPSRIIDTRAITLKRTIERSLNRTTRYSQYILNRPRAEQCRLHRRMRTWDSTGMSELNTLKVSRSFTEIFQTISPQ